MSRIKDGWMKFECGFRHIWRPHQTPSMRSSDKKKHFFIICTFCDCWSMMTVFPFGFNFHPHLNTQPTSLVFLKMTVRSSIMRYESGLCHSACGYCGRRSHRAAWPATAKHPLFNPLTSSQEESGKAWWGESNSYAQKKKEKEQQSTATI